MVDQFMTPEAQQLVAEFPQLQLLHPNSQTLMMHTLIRKATTTRADFVFYADRLVRLIIEEGLSVLPYTEKSVLTPTNAMFHGVLPAASVCGVSVIRAGEAMEQALRQVCRGIPFGKVLIQRNEASPNKEAHLSYVKLPRDIQSRVVLLMDPMLATGGSACTAIDALKSHGVLEEKIIMLHVVAAPEGIRQVFARFPNVRMVVSAIDTGLNESKFILPGLGDFGDRYFGT